jgi:NAD(P)H dehydrogenase (quinone)
MTVVVTGTTGQLGRLVVESLLRRGASPEDVVATGRDRARLGQLAQLGVRTAVADYSDAVALRTAVDGADRVLLVSGPDVGHRREQHATVVGAARAAGVGQLLYTSLPNADTARMALADDHRETERVVRESGIPFTFLRNSWYLENYLGQLPTYLEHGVVGATRGGRISAATRADYADAAAVALLAPDSAGLVGAGVSEGYARVLADADEGIARGELEVTSGDLERLIGHPPTSLREAVTKALAAA